MSLQGHGMFLLRLCVRLGFECGSSRRSSDSRDFGPHAKKTFYSSAENNNVKPNNSFGFLVSSVSRNTQSIRERCGNNGGVMGNRAFEG